jgi:hypothetical protein
MRLKGEASRPLLSARKRQIIVRSCYESSEYFGARRLRQTRVIALQGAAIEDSRIGPVGLLTHCPLRIVNLMQIKRRGLHNSLT